MAQFQQQVKTIQIIAAGRFFWDTGAVVPAVNVGGNYVGFLGAVRVAVGDYIFIFQQPLTSLQFTAVPSGQNVFYQTINKSQGFKSLSPTVKALFPNIPVDAGYGAVEVYCTNAAGAPAEADAIRMLVVAHDLSPSAIIL